MCVCSISYIQQAALSSKSSTEDLSSAAGIKQILTEFFSAIQSNKLFKVELSLEFFFECEFVLSNKNVLNSWECKKKNVRFARSMRRWDSLREEASAAGW